MRRTTATAIATLVLLAAGAGLAPNAHALNACTAADIYAQDGAAGRCPNNSGPCNIGKVFVIANGCTLDFGTRAVTILGSGTIDVLSNTVTIRAGSFAVAPSGRVEGRGTGSSAPTDRGGMVTLITTGAVDIQRIGSQTARGIVDFAGNVRGGSFIVTAGGPITVNGDVMANNLTPSGGNGNITLRSTGGNVTTGAFSTISVTGGDLSTGGFIDITASGNVDLGTNLIANGGDGGVIDISAGGSAVVRGMNATGGGDAGSGGCGSVFAGTNVQMLGPVILNGTGSPTLSGGGCGGFIDIDARFGDVTISSPITAESGAPDGGGGGVGVVARGSINVASVAPISVQGQGGQSCGGEIAFEADLDVTASSALNASGGFGGNLIDLLAGRNVTATAALNAAGRDAGGFGGGVTVLAGERGQGNAQINGVVDVTGGGCGTLNGCGLGGFNEIVGCNVTIASTSTLTTRGPDGGDNLVTAREQLRIDGTLDAVTTGGGTSGTNTIQFPSRLPKQGTGAINPAPNIQSLATCTAAGQTGCLVPCPSCGNGMVEFPETCDTSGTPVNCDGCASNCRVQNCNDSNGCTADSCDMTLGCRNQAIADGTSCSDSNICNGVEACLNGVCRPNTTPLNCNDSNACTSDSCDPSLGCQNPPTTLGSPCTDSNACTVGDSCNGMGSCTPGGAATCTDSNPCTTNSCNPTTGCVFPPAPNGTSCADTNVCNGAETCSSGSCASGTPLTCTDNNVCTQDTCDPMAGCQFPPTTAGGPCTDNNACTNGDTCNGSGGCAPGPALACDDNNVCTTNSCNPASGCVFPSVTSGATCDDGAYCTTTDTCQNGMCSAGPARDCSDTNSCTSDSCDEANDTCVNQQSGACCGDGTPNPGEQCDDGNTSNNDACLNTCVSATCGDGFLRTGVEQCDAGASNSNAPNAACRTDCTPRRCGDGITDTPTEQCDDGGTASGDGCSATCGAERPATAELIPGKGNTSTDCGLEWAFENPVLDRRGIPSIKQSCVDGDPACDHGTTPGECTIHVWVCANNTDSNLPLCTPGAAGIGNVAFVETRKPSSREAGLRPIDALNRQQLLAAADAAETTSPNSCGPRLAIRVPLRGTPAINKGVKVLKLAGDTDKAIPVRDSDVLKLFCLPATP